MNWCFWTVVLEKTLESPLESQSILKEISPEYSLEGLMLKLKLQYFGHLMWRTDSFEKTLLLGKIEDRRRDDRGWDGWITQWTWVWVNSRSWWWTGRPGVLQSMGLQRVGHDWAAELNWTSLHRRRKFYLSSSDGKQDSVLFQLNHAPSQWQRMQSDHPDCSKCPQERGILMPKKVEKEC